MIAPKFWGKKNFNSYLIALCLWPLSLFYLLIQSLRAFLVKTKKVEIPVICIGNLVVGGSGKTPVALEIGKILQDLDIDFAYLSLGYKGKIKDFTKVKHQHSAKDVGDEPILLSDIADSFICSNRFLGAKQISKTTLKKIIIMDDGLQNPSIFKDLKILVIDGDYGFGNELIIPSGPLRSTIKSGIKNSDLIIIIGEDRADIKKRFCFGKKIINAQIKLLNSEQFQNSSMIAFCGIGRPEKFFASLRKIEVNLVDQISYPDHYQYQDQDLNFLVGLAKKNAVRLITTKKDWVRLEKKYQEQISYLDMKIEFGNQDFLKEKIKNLCGIT